MKKLLFTSSVIVLLGIFISISGCKKDDTEKLSPIIFNPTVIYGSMTDQDGNTYKTVTIGTQTWMAENLRTTKFNDGTEIPLISDSNAWDSIAWHNTKSPAYCYYLNDAATYRNIYGALYNGYAVISGKLAPIGWHVATDADWTTLTEYLGGEGVAGGKLKETGTTHWGSPNFGATNESGFTSLPGGYRGNSTPDDQDAGYHDMGNLGSFWTATEHMSGLLIFCEMFKYGKTVIRPLDSKYHGFSVRCVKD